jgi:hypothetical protein
MAEGAAADHPHQALFRKNYARLLDQLGRSEEAAVLRAPAGPPVRRLARPSSGSGFQPSFD